MRFLFLPLALLVLSCSNTVSPDGGVDAGGDASVDDGGDAGAASCPAAMPTGGATCDVPATLHCMYGPFCAPCFGTAFSFQSPECSCYAGHWICSHTDCPGGCPSPGLFSDPACTMSCAPDAGSGDGGTADAGATFACGTTACMRNTEYCLVTTGGPAPGMIGYTCRPAPTGCVPARCSCLMFDGGGGGVGTSCMDDGMGATTAMLGLP